METTDNLDSVPIQDTGKQNNQAQQADSKTQNAPAKEPAYTTNFLEFGEPKNGLQSIAIIKEEGQKRGIKAASIYMNFPGDSKRPVFTAKDQSGNILYTSEKLWEIKKSIKDNAKPLLEQVKQYKNSLAREVPQNKEEPLAKKEFKAMGNKLADEGMEIGKAAHDAVHNIVSGSGRDKEIKNIRSKKVQKNRELQR